MSAPTLNEESGRSGAKPGTGRPFRWGVALILLVLAFGLSLWTLLVRSFPDDGPEFERRSAIVGRICAGVGGGVSASGDGQAELQPNERVEGDCESGQYERLKRRNAVPWLLGATLAGLGGAIVGWYRPVLRALSVPIVVILALVGLEVMRVPAEPPALVAKRELVHWLDTREFPARVSSLDVLQEQNGFTVGIWTNLTGSARNRARARSVARQVPGIVDAVHVFVLGREVRVLARWASPTAQPPRHRPHYAEPAPSPPDQGG